jgi:hypothetical protein
VGAIVKDITKCVCSSDDQGSTSEDQRARINEGGSTSEDQRARIDERGSTSKDRESIGNGCLKLPTERDGR